MEIKDLLRGVIKEMVEARMRETDITDGSRVPFGSQEHVTDLEMRIADLERWRDRQRRGSEARANYARLIGRLRAELRSANRIANPSAPPMPMVDELAENDVGQVSDGGKKKKKKTRKCTSCSKPFVATPADDFGMCPACGDEPAASARMSESAAGPGSWVVRHRDGYTIGFPTPDFDKAQAIADVRNDVAINGAWGRNNPTADPPYEVMPYEPEPLGESVNMKDPEYSSIETFVQFLLDDERDSYNHEELTALNFRTRMPVNAIRKELEGYGLTLANRPNEKKVRGFSSNSNDRWFGPGSMATHGGAGIDPQTGRATSGRGDI